MDGKRKTRAPRHSRAAEGKQSLRSASVHRSRNLESDHDSLGEIRKSPLPDRATASRLSTPLLPIVVKRSSGEKQEIQRLEATFDDAPEDMLQPNTLAAIDSAATGSSQSIQDAGPQELNIVVLGHAKTGKSTFIKSALDLKKDIAAAVSSKKVSLEGCISVVRLIEIDAHEIRFEGDSIRWPDLVHKTAPGGIDGALLLFDVTNALTFEHIERTISAMSRSSKPMILVLTKCDTPPKTWQITTGKVNSLLSRHGKVESFQTALRSPETHKRCISVMFRNIMLQRQDNVGARTPCVVARRPRAVTGAAVQTPPSAPAGVKPTPKHNRAISDISNIGSGKPGRAKFNDSWTDDMVDHRKDWESRTLNMSIPADDSCLPQRKYMSQKDGLPLTKSRSSNLHAAPSDQRTPEVTFVCLVERLLKAPISKHDSKFRTIFLCFYPKFAHPSVLMKEIIDRFEAVEQYEQPELLQTATRLRYLEILQSWMIEYACDFFQAQTRDLLLRFLIDLSLDATFATAYKELSKIAAGIQEDETVIDFLDHRRSRASTLESYRSRSSIQSTTSTVTADSSTEDSTGPGKSPVSSIARHSAAPIAETGLEPLSNQSSSSSTSCQYSSEDGRQELLAVRPFARFSLDKTRWRQLMDLPEELIATELTRIDWLLYSAIRPRDLIKHISMGPGSKGLSHGLEHVSATVDHFNHIALWAANLILLRDKPKHRALMLEKFLAIAWKLRYLNNYNSLGAMIAGINGTAVHRLTQTRALVSAEARKQFMRLEILMGTSKSHAAYRLAWQNTSGPRIPFLPLHLRDLVSAEAGNKTFIQSMDGEKVNWKKFEIMGDVVLGIQESQNLAYPKMRKNSEIYSLIMGCKFTRDEDELFDRSVQLETQDGVDQSRRKFGIFPR